MKKFEEPIVEFIALSVADVITESGPAMPKFPGPTCITTG